MKEKSKFRAVTYDPLLYIFLNPVRYEVAEMLISLEGTDKKILDMCCGTGNQLKILAEHGFTDLCGVDISSAMTSVAKKNNHSIRIYTEDAADTGFQSASFDIVLLSYSIHEKKPGTRTALLKEAHRLLKKDGFLVIADYEFAEEIKPFTRLVIFFIERIAGKDHFRNFRHYCENDGLKGVVDSTKYEYMQRRPVLFDSTVLSVLRKK